METIRLGDVEIAAAALRAAATLQAGGVIMYPTDTLYGLGADALSEEAVAKIKRIKGRDEGKPIHAIVSGLEMVERYAVISKEARMLAKKLWPGPLTLILEKRAGINTGIARNIDTFGARAADNSFCLALAREFGKPYTGTSANKSGEKPERSVDNILAQLGKTASDIDIIIDAGELPECLPSTVVDMRSGRPIILREGAVPTADVWNALQAEL